MTLPTTFENVLDFKMTPDELKEYLETHPPEVSAVIAARIALRTLPITSWQNRSRENPMTFKILTYAMWASLNALAAGTWSPETSIQNVIRAANSASMSSADAAPDASARAAAISARKPKNAKQLAADRAAQAAGLSSLTSKIDGFSAILGDIGMLTDGAALEQIRVAPLWPIELPNPFAASWGAFHEDLVQISAFEFWSRLHKALCSGGEQNWAKLQEIILIDYDVWVEGADAVAAEINAIEAKYTAKPIPKSILREQVTVLLQNATIAHTSGNSLAHQIEDAITTYLREEECNGLPEDLSVLEHLPAALRRLTSAVSAAMNDESRVAELELAIQAMASEIQSLKDQLEALQSAPQYSPFLKSFKEQSGKSLGDLKMWGTLISGSYLLLGEPAAGTTLEHIADSLKSLIGPPP